jgi:hypothetical protein
MRDQEWTYLAAGRRPDREIGRFGGGGEYTQRRSGHRRHSRQGRFAGKWPKSSRTKASSRPRLKLGWRATSMHMPTLWCTGDTEIEVDDGGNLLGRKGRDGGQGQDEDIVEQLDGVCSSRASYRRCE